MMTLNDIYCNGKGCLLKDQCKKYVNSKAIYINKHGDTNQYRWMDNCDPETRDGYISTED